MIDALDIETMRRIAEHMFVPKVYKAYGRPGTSALREVIGFLIQLYAHLEPALTEGTIYVVRRLENADPTALANALGGQFRTENRIDRLPTRRISRTLALELLDGGVVRVCEDAAVDENAASEVAVVYRFHADQEYFIIRGRAHVVENPAPIHVSVFARPTFSSLREALLDYRDRLVRTSTCYVLRTAWDEDSRLFLRAGPEYLIRRSLHQHLRTVLRDAEVRPEQNVDESHPPDIKVTWTFTMQIAFIEIKWLGKSREQGKITAVYSEVRAREGARQLAEYLDSNRTTMPERGARGYLVIIDARRYGLSAGSTTISRARGMYYETREITYDPAYHKLREDFDPPIRMFVEPICEDPS